MIFTLDHSFFIWQLGSMSIKNLDFMLSPTQTAYVFSDATINVIVGNTGEGKTHASIAAMPVHAERCGRPIRAAIVRDTHENIKSSTARSIQEAFEDFPQLIKFKNDFKQLTIFSEPRVEVDLFGIDDLASLSKLQGPEYAFIWLEEPAPIADKSNAGLSIEVFRAALVRCARQKGTRPRLQISMNPADKEHWTYKELIEAPDVLPDYPLITKKVWFIKYGENQHVSEASRQAVKVAYKDDPASYTRYVEGKFAPVYRGVKVAESYNPERHQSNYILIPARGLVSFAFFDSWHNPACVLGQITTTGRLIYIDTLRLLGGDIRTLMEMQVLPLLNSPKWKDKSRSWRIGGDFSMKIPDQSNLLETASQVVEEAFWPLAGGRLKPIFEAGPSKWPPIEQHIGAVLRGSDSRGEPLVLLSADNHILHTGLEGAWHYPTNNAGQISSRVPEKDEASHPCDAWAASTCVLLSSIKGRKIPATYRDLARKNRQRVQTYAVGGR